MARYQLAWMFGACSHTLRSQLRPLRPPYDYATPETKRFVELQQPRTDVLDGTQLESCTCKDILYRSR